MNTLSFSTHFATKEEAKKEWVVVDATDQIVGRLAAKVADKIQFTGAKWTDKQYLTYSGYPSGQHKINPENLAKKPHGYERILRHAVKGMLPKGHLGTKILNNLYIYEGAEHEQQAQNPKSIDINALK